MEKPVLGDPNEFPCDEVLARCLGKAKPAWDAFRTLLKERYPQLVAEWRYYADGKSWLCKLTRKSATVSWVAACDRYFTVACYLNAKAEPLVRDSSLDRALKQPFLRSSQKLRAIRIEVRSRAALDAVRELIDIKLSVK